MYYVLAKKKYFCANFRAFSPSGGSFSPGGVLFCQLFGPCARSLLQTVIIESVLLQVIQTPSRPSPPSPNPPPPKKLPCTTTFEWVEWQVDLRTYLCTL